MKQRATTDMLEKFLRVERALVERKGEFRLFALVLRGTTWGRWELMLSAPWMNTDNLLVALEDVAAEIKSQMGTKGLLSLSKMVPFKTTDECVRAINEEYQVKHGKLELRDGELCGGPIERAVIITSQRRARSLQQRRARPRYAGAR